MALSPDQSSQSPEESPTGPPNPVTAGNGVRRALPLRFFAGIEDFLLAFSLVVLILLPLSEAVLRRFFGSSISQAAVIVQHLVLVVALVGGAVAARESRLLALSTLTDALPGFIGRFGRIFAGSVGCAICAGLGYAGYQLLEVQQGFNVAGIPVEHLLWLMPACFALIGLRLAMRASSWIDRATALACAALIVFAATRLPLDQIPVALGAFTVLAAAGVFGLPIFAVLGGSALILFLAKQEPLAAISISQYDMAVNPTLPAVPLFTLAGYFLAEGGASRRLVRVFQSVFGHLRGGTGVMTVLVCAFFTSFTGASGVTILALGGLLMPVLINARYSERASLGIITGAGSLGLLLPPCLPLILYAIIASNAAIHQGISVGISEMFAAGVVPGLVLAALAATLVILQQPASAENRPKFSWPEAGAAVWDAKWELMLPVIAMGALLGGFATPVEAAALTALYAVVVEVFIYRDMRLSRDVPRVLVECGLLIGGILLILGVAMGLTNYLVDAQVPDAAVDWAKASLAEPWMFLVAVNILLLLAGCLMDIYSALVIIVPIIVPVALAFDVNLVHLGVIFLSNLQLGYLTPPVGMNLFMTSYRFGKPMPEVVRSVIPMLIIFTIGVALITAIPQLSTALPEALRLTGR